MKIGIDARIYGPKHGGIGRYVEQLLKQIDLQENKQDEFVVFMMQDDVNTINFKNKKIKKVVADIKWYSAREQISLTKIIKKEKLDIMHFTHFNVPLNYNDKFIVTIHDLIMYHFSRKEATTKSFLVYNIKDFIHKIVTNHAAKKAEHIIAVSEFTKQDIINTLEINADKISVVYQGVTKLNSHTLHSKNQSKYLLYVGSAYPHKNLNKLLEAFNIFSFNNRDVKLIIAGKKDRFYERLQNSDQYKFCKNVELKLGISDDELADLYSNASAFVFPSLYEGFGLPPIEAMQFYLPVLSSSRSCLPEVLGEAALYEDPEEVEAFANAIEKIIFDEEIRQEIVSNIYKELTRYSWENCVKKTMSIYRQNVV